MLQSSVDALEIKIRLGLIDLAVLAVIFFRDLVFCLQPTMSLTKTANLDLQEFKKPEKAAPWNYQIMYGGILSFGFFHIGAIYGLYLLMTSSVSKATVLLNVFTYLAAGLGVTAGAHRLWSHKSYKAKTPLQIILMLFQSMAFQYTVIDWVMQHRIHHKYCDTDADPHNASRGFFFSHIGWLLVTPHEEFKKRYKLSEIPDATSNPVLMFQKRHAYLVISVMAFLLPTIIPVAFWGETLNNAWHINMLRYVLNLHATFSINSVAHKYGNKPYNTKILPTQNNFVSLVICGEGFHNYHHSFPWDYRAAELGNNILNLSSIFIDLCAWIGWAYDLKTVKEDAIIAKASREGDGTDSWGRVN